MKILILLGLSFVINNVFANQYWIKNTQSARSSNSLTVFQLDIDAFKTKLYQLNSQDQVTLTLPRLNGSLHQFTVSETHVVAAELALKYPQLKTYKIQHLTQPGIRGRMEVMNNKVSVMLKTADGQELIELSAGAEQSYNVQKKQRNAGQKFSCGTAMSNNSPSLAMRVASNSQYRAPINQLTKLKLAIATTVEYSAKFGTTKADVLAEIKKAVNRINEVYESELAITFELVNNNENIIFINSDDLSNDNASLLIDESQSLIDSKIGSANYDIGHVFSTGAGGLASVGVTCDNSFKAEGVTGNNSPTSDSFWIDYVAHELGHQLGAEHTFNGTTGSCSGINRVAAVAVEPGSGSSIMAYAGICGSENLQSNSDDSFHSTSVKQIFAALPSSCGTDVSYSSINSGINNFNSPSVNAGSNVTIPINTPFMLTANATDADGDALFYQWDQTDAGTATSSSTIGLDLGDNALFRSNRPQSNATRYFPSMATLLSGTAEISETLATKNRAINFSVKVTDAKGGYASDNVTLTANKSFDGFSVTSQSTTQSFVAKQAVTVSWNTANTSSFPISCSNVEVQLLSISADGNTFSAQTIASNQTNDGATSVILPNENSAKSRFLVKCESNVFFAINSADFTITGSTVDATASNDEQSTRSGTQESLVANPDVVSDTESSGGGGGLPLALIMLFSGLFLARRYA